jgi:hypothetical protein
MTENPSTRNIYMPIAFAAGVLVGGAGALLLRPKVSTWRSTFNANRVARTARKKEFAAVKEIYDAYSSFLSPFSVYILTEHKQKPIPFTAPSRPVFTNQTSRTRN